MMESRVRYGICFWGNCSRGLFNLVFMLQKWAIRYMFGAGYRDSCRPLFKSHKILTLTSLFILETVRLMYKKHKSGIDNRSLCSGYATRQTHHIELPIPYSTLIKKSIVYDSKKIFNHLPINARTATSERIFEAMVKGLLLEKAYYSLEEYFHDILVMN